MDLLKIGLVSDRLDPFQLRDTAEWIMKPALLAVPGVAHVLVFGGAEREIDIQPDLRRMTSYGFALTDLADAARQALALRGAGFVDVAHQRVLIQTPIPSPDPTAIAHAVVGVRNNIPITIADIATLGWVNNLVTFYEARELVDFDRFANVAAWLERGLSRPGVQRGLKVPARA